MALLGIEMTNDDPVGLVVEAMFLQSMIEVKYERYGVHTMTNKRNENTTHIFVYINQRNCWLVRQWLVFRIKRLLRNEIYKHNTKLLWSMI